MQQIFTYHKIVENFQGDYILPLNQLAKIHPEISTKHAQKYIGREETTEKIVYNPIDKDFIDLGKNVVYWGDVAFFTLHSPSLFMEALKDIGLNPPKQKYFKISLQRFSPNTFIWKFTKKSQDYIPISDCITLNQADTIDITKIPNSTAKYYKEMVAEGKKPRMYAYTPHLLTTDPVYISGCEIIEA